MLSLNTQYHTKTTIDNYGTNGDFEVGNKSDQVVHHCPLMECSVIW